ncbi:MAG: SMC-Scp complex subunit ScpB [Phycisphaerae bacterium]|jgi:segregation and condensation protein B
MVEPSGSSANGRGDESRPEIRTEAIVEALLFATDQPLSAGKIADILGIGDAGDVRRHISALNERYAEAGTSFRIEAVAKGFQMLTGSVYDPWVGKLHKARSDSRLSPAALETLAIVAYRQPVLRADIEAVRGVAVGDMLVRLREMNLIRIVGRAEELGRPLLYGTTSKFLEVFGLSSIKDLPKLDPDRPDDVPPLKVVSTADEEDPIGPGQSPTTARNREVEEPDAER